MRGFPLLLYTIAAVFGMVVATAIFPPHTDSFVLTTFYKVTGIRHDFSPFRAKGLRYSGTLERQDAGAGTITLSIPSSFPLSSTSTSVTFAYDADTLWSSFEYTFEDAILETRKVLPEEPRALPEGTLVTMVVHPYATSPLYATAVYFLRKTEL